MRSRLKQLLAVGFVVLLAACGAKLDFLQVAPDDEVFRIALDALNNGRKAVAIAGFHRLRDNLNQSDRRRVLAIYYLGKAYSLDKDPLSAAREFRQLQATYSTDTLADDALFLAAQEERKLWPHPELDDTYGRSARQLLDQLLQTYPDTPLREAAFEELRSLEEGFATKLFEVGMDHFRSKRYAPAEMMFKEVVEYHPATATARKARLKIVESLQRLKWNDQVREQCLVLQQLYRDDAEVVKLCGGGVAAEQVQGTS
jgi:outer membrane assembly lipoprotein YfiO